MAQQVASNATHCQAHVASRVNDKMRRQWQRLLMTRFHYIPEWAKQAKKKQVHLALAAGVDKSNVSRWYKGVIPDRPHLEAIARLVEAPEPAALFVHPAEYKILQDIRALSGAGAPAA